MCGPTLPSSSPGFRATNAGLRCMCGTVAQILELTPANCWNHVIGKDNPADSVLCGTWLSELLNHKLWWNGSKWLKFPQEKWPKPINSAPHITEMEEDTDELNTTACHLSTTESFIPIDKFSSYKWLGDLIC